MKLYNPLDKPSIWIALCISSLFTALIALLVYFAIKVFIILFGLILLFSILRTIYFIFAGK